MSSLNSLNSLGLKPCSVVDNDRLIQITRRVCRGITNTSVPTSWQPRLADIIMDLTVVHQTIGLRLDDMLHAPVGDLIHDVGGISRHLNRETGELGDCFLPRYAVSQSKQK